MAYYEGTIGDLGCCNNGNNNGAFGNNGDWIWAFLLFALLGNNGWGIGGGYGGGRGGYDVCCGTPATQADLANGFAQNTLQRGIDDIILGQAQAINYNNQGFAGLNSVINTGFAGVNNAICTLGYQNAQLVNGISRELSECCCSTARAIDGVNYNIATQFGGLNTTLCGLGRDIIENQNANYRALHEELVANKIEAKNERIAELQDQLYRADLRASQAQQSNYITDTIINKLSPCPSPSYIVPNPNCCYNYGVYPVNSGCGASVQ